MKTKLLLLLVLFVSFSTYSQFSSKYIALGKEYSKDESLFKAKAYLINNILDVKEEIVEFYVDPLAAASSGELTTLVYKCKEQNKEGLLLVFYGNYWNEEGVVYQAYAFKNFNRDEATAFFHKINNVIEEHKDFIKEDFNNYNNIVFKYDDMQIVIWGGKNTYNFRIFWNRFDSSWEATSYERTKKRFEKRID